MHWHEPVYVFEDIPNSDTSNCSANPRRTRSEEFRGKEGIDCLGICSPYMSNPCLSSTKGDVRDMNNCND